METMKLENIRQIMLKCDRCDLYKTKTNYVFGEGNEKAKIMLIGEAPGSNEDKHGRPFVGRAGIILNELLDSVNIDRENIFISNILHCRPPGNRQPTENETQKCTFFLNWQLALIKPKIICPLGNHATDFIMKEYGLKDKVEGISKLHGKVFKVSSIEGEKEIIPLYHPAVATYNPDMKKVLMEDIKVLKGKDE